MADDENCQINKLLEWAFTEFSGDSNGGDSGSGGGGGEPVVDYADYTL